MTFETGIEVLLGLLSISFVLCFVRLYRGPDVPNRTVAFDLISTHAVGLFALFAIRNNSFFLLDGAMVTAMMGFLGTLMLARYLEQDSDRFPDSE